MALLNDILSRYLGGNAGPGQVSDDFNHVAQNVPTDVLSKGFPPRSVRVRRPRPVR